MPTKSSIQVLNLDFDTIKAGLKAYLSSRSELSDYNFEGSTINLLLDILSYNTYQNAFYTSMVGNEMFLDSAQLRESVVSRAKMLDYFPRSSRGSSVDLNISIEPGSEPDSITIPKNTEFTSTIDGVTYTWVTPVAYTLINDGLGVYESNTVTIVEGIPLTHKWTVDSNSPVRYIIPNEKVDSTSITVIVRESVGSSNIETFNLANDILSVTGDSAIFFLQEVEDSKIEIYFGDDIIGKSPINGNVVEISYRVCNEDLTNGVSSFSGPSTIAGYDFTFEINDQTIGGAKVETIESIKFSAPKAYETQNRAVLSNDYKSLITENFSYIDSIRVWGGEENDPPVYGKVFISIKPTTGAVLGQSRKNDIAQFLSSYSVLSIDPEFIDPTYLYIDPEITVNYKSTLTSLNVGDLRSKIVTNILNYETSNLGSFDNSIFRYSRFLDIIDDSDASIQSNTTMIKLEKRFYPNTETSTKYTIFFNNSLEKRAALNTSAITSSSFSMMGQTAFLEDDGAGVIKTYYLSGTTKIYINETQGTVDYTNGVVTLDEFQPELVPGGELRIFASPVTNTTSTSKHQLMLFGSIKISMYDEDTGTTTSAVTVNTLGSVTQVIESGFGTVI